MAISVRMVLAALGFTALSLLTAADRKKIGDVPASAPQTSAEAPANYVLGPGDDLVIKVIDVDEISTTPIRIDPSGSIKLPLIGWVSAGGLTLQQLDTELIRRFTKYVAHPDVTVSIAQSHSQPVSVFGAVNNPGIQQLQGSKTLVEMLSLAGGLRPDAGNVVRITRLKQWGTIPLPSASAEPGGRFYTAEVSLRDLLDARRPGENIDIRPRDVISVPRADMIYVVGDVTKAGGFVLNERASISVLQALALAQGLGKSASPSAARILHRTDDASVPDEIHVHLDKIMAGKAADVPLKADDVLFIPTSMAKKVSIRAIEALVQAGTGIAIWHQ